MIRWWDIHRSAAIYISKTWNSLSQLKFQVVHYCLNQKGSRKKPWKSKETRNDCIHLTTDSRVLKSHFAFSFSYSSWLIVGIRWLLCEGLMTQENANPSVSSHTRPCSPSSIKDEGKSCSNSLLSTSPFLVRLSKESMTIRLLSVIMVASMALQIVGLPTFEASAHAFVSCMFTCSGST